MLAIFAASLIASYVATRIDPDFAFYMMFFRAFEFAVGALVLLMEKRPLPVSLRQVYGAAGFALIALSLVWFDGTTVWPGANSLVPSLGAAALILAGPQAAPNRLLANAGLILIGRRSYSIYLVHWPLIVFYRYWTMVPLTLLEMVGLFIGALALGALLFAVIEKPFRYGLRPILSSRSFGRARRPRPCPRSSPSSLSPHLLSPPPCRSPRAFRAASRSCSSRES